MSLNRIGVHAGVWGFDWSPDAVARTIAVASEIGYDYLEIPAIDRALNDSEVTRRLLDQHDIGATVSLALDFASDINTTNAQSSSRGEYRLMEAVEFANSIGADFVGGVIYSAMGRYERLPTAEGRNNSLAVLRRVAQRASSYGITLGVEYVNRYESHLLNTCAQALQFIEDLGVSNAVVHLDTFHAHIEEVDVTLPFTQAGTLLGYIHASESHRGLLGTGSIDWDHFMRTLVEHQCTAPITLETFSSAVITREQAIEIGLWTPMWSDPDQVASDSFAFLRSRLSAALSARELVN
jgi:D-psicose/D-tagatose/L-ribulose 3-epimerase